LYAITNSEEYGGIPAGIFYMPAMRAKDSAPKKRRMSGLMAKDEALLYAMDKTKKGEFVPEMSSRYADSFIEAQDFDKIFDFTARKLKTAGNDIYSGNIAANPVDGLGSPACKYCEFASVCRIEKEKPLAVPRLSNTDVISEIGRQVEEDGI
ncbi:MAG: PD-(D/E)XK nuclease family protein, partial [Clostridia bacterium]|nr:PD-(D/E)XK nuclease family protein [Clostridia bacterium]